MTDQGISACFSRLFMDGNYLDAYPAFVSQTIAGSDRAGDESEMWMEPQGHASLKIRRLPVQRTDKYCRVIYRCNSKYKDKKCEIPHVTEEEVKVAFLSAYNKLVSEKAGMVESVIDENARIAQDQGGYQERYNGLVERYDTVKARYDEVAQSHCEKEAQNERLAGFIKILKAQDGIIAEFDERIWSSMVDFATVGRNKETAVTFRDGTEITA